MTTSARYYLHEFVVCSSWAGNIHVFRYILNVLNRFQSALVDSVVHNNAQASKNVGFSKVMPRHNFANSLDGFRRFSTLFDAFRRFSTGLASADLGTNFHRVDQICRLKNITIVHHELIYIEVVPCAHLPQLFDPGNFETPASQATSVYSCGQKSQITPGFRHVSTLSESLQHRITPDLHICPQVH